MNKRPLDVGDDLDGGDMKRMTKAVEVSVVAAKPVHDEGAAVVVTATSVAEQPEMETLRGQVKKSWLRKFDMLTTFVEANGHAQVARRDDQLAYPGLFQWCAAQRTAFRKIKRRENGEVVKGTVLNAAQINLLNSVGFEWQSLTLKRRDLAAWNLKFELLTKFYQQNGHSRVPHKLDTVDYPTLGAWCYVQRSAYRNEQTRAAGQKPKTKARIDADKIARLEAIGFEWVVGKGGR